MFDITSGVVSLLGIPQQFSGDAGLTAESELTAAGTAVRVASASLTAESDLTAAAIQVHASSASLTAESDLTATGIYVGVAQAALTAESSLTADATLVQPGASIIIGTSDLVATGTRVALGTVSMSAESDLTANGTLVVAGAQSALSAESDLVSTGTIVIPDAASVMGAELTLGPLEALPIYRLIQQVYEQVYTDNILMSRYGIDTGKTILIKDNIVTVTDYVYQTEFEDADYAYQGGRWYQLSQEEYEAFVNAGRPDLVEVA